MVYSPTSQQVVIGLILLLLFLHITDIVFLIHQLILIIIQIVVVRIIDLEKAPCCLWWPVWWHQQQNRHEMSWQIENSPVLQPPIDILMQLMDNWYHLLLFIGNNDKQTVSDVFLCIFNSIIFLDLLKVFKVGHKSLPKYPMVTVHPCWKSGRYQLSGCWEWLHWKILSSWETCTMNIHDPSGILQLMPSKNMGHSLYWYPRYLFSREI